MKRLMFSLAACLFCSGAAFADLEALGTLSNKEEFLDFNYGTFNLSISKTSEAICRVYFPLARTQTWVEWVQGQQVVPQQYVYNSKDWDFGSEIEIHLKGNLNENFSFALNRSALESCSHYLLNKNTGAILFTSVQYIDLEEVEEQAQDDVTTERGEDYFFAQDAGSESVDKRQSCDDTAMMIRRIFEERDQEDLEETPEREISENFEIFLSKEV